MAYSRFKSDGSNVYVYHDVRGFIVCMRCAQSERGEFRAPSRSAMIEHLQRHLLAGEQVPKSTFNESESEIAALGDAIEP